MLHNTDKNSEDRSNPKPNTHDTITDTVGRMAHGTLSTNYNTPDGSVADNILQNGFFKIVDIQYVSFTEADFISSGNTYLQYFATDIITLPSSIINPIVWAFLELPSGDLQSLPYYQFDFDTGDLEYQIQVTNNNPSYVVVRSTIAIVSPFSIKVYFLQQSAT